MIRDRSPPATEAVGLRGRSRQRGVLEVRGAHRPSRSVGPRSRRRRRAVRVPRAEPRPLQPGDLEPYRTDLVSERELQDWIVASARLLGWRVAHFRPAWTQRGWRTAGSYDAQGWPDLVLVRERVVFAEVKTDRGRLRPEQEGWLGSLRHAGAEVYVWRPEDWTSGEVEDVLRRRAA